MTITEASWIEDAFCTQDDAERLFDRSGASRAARTVCGRCSVRTQCLAFALETPEEFGVWGGLTAYERQVLRWAFPHITDWKAALRTCFDRLIAALDTTGSAPNVRLARKLAQMRASAPEPPQRR